MTTTPTRRPWILLGASVLALVAAGCSSDSQTLRPANQTLPTFETPTVPPVPTVAIPIDTVDVPTLPSVTEPPIPVVKPTKATPKPTSTTKHKATTTSKKPTATTKKPTVTTKKPTVTTKKPTVTTKKPTVTTKKPTATTVHPKPTENPNQPTTTVKAKPVTTTTEATPPEPVEAVGSGNGIGNLTFGSAAVAGRARLDLTFGTPKDTALRFPKKKGDLYLSSDGALSFAHPYALRVCYGNGLCAYFGGASADPATMTLVGWAQTNPTSGSPVTASGGIGVGSTQELFSSLPVTPGACPNLAAATTDDGVTLLLKASKGTFSDTRDTQVTTAPTSPATAAPTTPAAGPPDPKDVVVIEMRSGHVVRATAAPTC